MEIRGKTYDFLLSVGAEQEIARLCRDGELKNLKELLTAGNAEAIESNKEVLCILSRWAEKARAFFEPDYEPQPLSKELLDLLPIAQYRLLQAEAMQAMARDQRQTVEAEPEKKRNSPTSS